MDRKRKRQSGGEFWTTAKCQRLLRPIASRIAPLKRHQYTLKSELSRNIVEEQLLPAVREQDLPRKEAVRNNANTTLLDPTWLPPDQNSRRQLKKYSTSHRHSRPPSGQIDSPQACLVSLPTPFKARALRRGTPIKHGSFDLEHSNSPCASRALPLTSKRQRKDPFTRAPTAKQSIELQGRQNYERTFELHQGVTDGFSLLLQRTCSADSKEAVLRQGASSLLSMCLRRVPDYIRAEEDWRKSIDEDDDTDVSAEVYEELEDLGSIQGHGWSGLREVVVAHGVSLVHEIIEDKLVATETRAELARIPAKYGLHKTSEDLLFAYAQSLPLKRPLGVDSRLFDGCLSSLTMVQPASAKNEVFIRLLDRLFSSGRLKISWLATRDMVSLSSGMIRALASQSGDFGHILHFLQGRISQISGAELAQKDVKRQRPEANLDVWTKLEKSLSNTTVSIVTVLTAIVLIERNTHDPNDSSERCTAAESLLTRLSIIVLGKLRAMEHKSNAKSPAQQRTVCFTLLASSLILSVKRAKNSTNQILLRHEDILQGMVTVHGDNSTDHNQSMVERAASFLVNLSRCCEQSLHMDSQSYLENLVRSLMEDSQDGSHTTKTFLKQWALESSLLSAKISATQRSRHFLDDVEAAMAQHKPLSDQTTTIASRSMDAHVAEHGLRWEEGLCEWIIASPLRTRKAQNVPAITTRSRSSSSSDQDNDLDDSGYLSEVKETPTFRRKTINISSMLASPDVLGFDSQTPYYSKIDLEAHRVTIESQGATPARQSPEPLAPQIKAPDTDQTVAKPLRTTGRITVSEKSLEIVERPAKRRKGRTTTDVKPKVAFPVLRTAQQASRSSEQDYIPEGGSDLSESEVDELAMSCSKPRQKVPIARKAVPPKSLSKIPAKRASNRIVDISDDELGF